MEQSETAAHAIEYVDLLCDHWNAELKSLITTRDNIKALKEEGGYRLTHIGCIQKADGNPFSGMNWIDAPHALTEVRNSLVHPEHKHRRQFNNVYHEAWNLGLWYLEMGILAICDYSGNYVNRLKQRWVGQVEDITPSSGCGGE